MSEMISNNSKGKSGMKMISNNLSQFPSHPVLSQ